MPKVRAHPTLSSSGSDCHPVHRTRARFVLLLSALARTLAYLVSQGGKNRRRGKNENEDDKRELVFREDGQEYAQVTKMLGNGRLEAQCFDGQKRLAHIRGKMRKKASMYSPVHVSSFQRQNFQVWINQGDIVLLSLREFQDDKADVIVKYTADEARNCKLLCHHRQHLLLTRRLQ